MQRIVRSFLASAGLLLFCQNLLHAEDWHYPLYLDGGQPHLSRREITVNNNGAQEINGSPKITLEGRVGVKQELNSSPVELAAKSLGLIGSATKNVRIVDSTGEELLYSITPLKDTFEADAQLFVPVRVAAKESTKFWVYYNNDKAWPVPDFWSPPAAGFSDSFESGDGKVPPGWFENGADEQHINSRSDSVARTGKRSLQTSLAPGATPNWVKFARQISVSPGSRYKVRGWVKGEDVEGGLGAGLFLHVGPKGNESNNPVNKWRNFGTFDWKCIEFSGTVPSDANSIIIGTVLHATKGTAWFDDIELQIEPASASVSITVGPEETLTYKPALKDEAWMLSTTDWPERIRFSARNFTDRTDKQHICSIPINWVTHANYPAEAFTLMLDGKKIPFLLMPGEILFELPEIPAKTEKNIWVYLAANRSNQDSNIRLKQASTILSDVEAAGPSTLNKAEYERLLYSSANMAKNYSFEEKDGWSFGGEKYQNASATTRIVDGGLFGGKKAVLDIPADAPRDFYGFRQQIPVVQGRSYLVTGWIECNGNAAAWVHEFSRGKPSAFANWSANSSTPVKGVGWVPFAINVKARHDDPILEVHLTNTKGRYAYDGIIVTEITAAALTGFERFKDRQASHDPAVWQVNTVKKIYPHSTPPENPQPLNISLARNESEGLQLALRSSGRAQELKLEVDAPSASSGAKLSAPQINAIGYVMVDQAIGYPHFTDVPEYSRCIPPSNFVQGELCPDPLIPRATLSLKPGETQGVYLVFNAAENAAPGNYRGEIRVLNGSAVLKRIPYDVTVWNFALPKRPAISAIFDNRHVKGQSMKRYSAMEGADFTRQFRLSYDEIPAKPKFWREGDEVKADFTEFDKAAKIWFDEWAIPLAYLPLFREHFGWGHPPKNFLGVAPYPGQWPYAGADRRIFTPEYKKVCQQALRLMMDHLREKGWQDRFLLYVSDEPDAADPKIRVQMAALYDLFHEVEPTLPIYSSTWGYVPDLLGKLDVWGIGVQGQISLEDIKKIKSAGSKIMITTDGQMCLETPHNSIERLLPLYAWTYDAIGYEFWGADWLTRNPFEWGIHTVHWQSMGPGDNIRLRYPNGDGYIFYPGNLIGVKGPVSTIRMQALRDGMEDHAYYVYLAEWTKKTGDPRGTQIMDRLKTFVGIPNAGGRKSEYLLPDPDRLTDIRLEIGALLSQKTNF